MYSEEMVKDPIRGKENKQVERGCGKIFQEQTLSKKGGLCLNAKGESAK